MTFTSQTFKTSCAALALAIAASTALPVTSASAHDRKNPNRHYGDGQWMNKKQHRAFHRQYGRGHQGEQAYRNQISRQHHRSNKKKRNRDLLAAGIVGLAVGAIIASQSKPRHQPTYQPQPSPYQPSGDYYNSYDYSPYDQPQQQYVPLDSYSPQPRANSGPNVITYNEPPSLEPWTPGWRQWCENNYRSFNAITGTFRGYDGLDHFCVPK